MSLSPKQAAFVREYLIDLNATQAAIRAGYSKKTAQEQGSRLLSNAIVRAEIDRLQEERQERVQISADYVVANLGEIVERCMQRAPVMVRAGRKMVQLIDQEGRHVWEFNANGANKALELLGRHLGMFKDKVEISGASELADAIEAARRRAK